MQSGGCRTAPPASSKKLSKPNSAIMHMISRLDCGSFWMTPVGWFCHPCIAHPCFKICEFSLVWLLFQGTLEGKLSLPNCLCLKTNCIFLCFLKVHTFSPTLVTPRSSFFKVSLSCLCLYSSTLIKRSVRFPWRPQLSHSPMDFQLLPRTDLCSVVQKVYSNSR